MAQRGICAPVSKFIGDRMRLQGECIEFIPHRNPLKVA